MSSTVSTTTTIVLNGHAFKITIEGDDVVPSTRVRAKAGPDFTANIMENQPDITVSLDGSQSTGDITKVVWSQTAGPATVKIKDDSKLQTDFVASQPGIYSFILGVGDNAGNASTDGLVITVTKAGVIPPPPEGTDPGLPTGNWKEQPEKGGDKNPHTWRVTAMTKNPNWFKVVDSSQVNIAVEFTTRAAAQQYIDHFIYVYDHQTPPQPPVDHGCTATQHWDEAQQKCVENPPPQPGGAKDLEGIQMLYTDDVSKAAQQFFLSREGPNHARVDGKGVRKVNPDGTVQITPDSGTNPASARIYVFTTTSDHSIEAQLVLGKDWNKMISLSDADGVNRGGWMVTNQDYRDVEVTQYYKIPTIKTDDEMTMYLGGHHPSGGFPDQCVSSCYKAQIQTKDCTTRAAIEWDHYNSPSNYAWWDGKQDLVDLKSELGGSMAGKLIGQKWVRYNEIGADGKVKAVHMELYVDLASKDLSKPDFTKQNWRLMNEWVHDGTNWPTKPADNAREAGCNAAGIKMPYFGSDSISIRFDESPWILYALSVRPILPKKIGGVA
jgi:K319L-like, PKD domain